MVTTWKRSRSVITFPSELKKNHKFLGGALNEYTFS
jgi:hypothetical protein